MSDSRESRPIAWHCDEQKKQETPKEVVRQQQRKPRTRPAEESGHGGQGQQGGSGK